MSKNNNKTLKIKNNKKFNLKIKKRKVHKKIKIIA